MELYLHRLVRAWAFDQSTFSLRIKTVASSLTALKVGPYCVGRLRSGVNALIKRFFSSSSAWMFEQGANRKIF